MGEVARQSELFGPSAWATCAILPGDGSALFGVGGVRATSYGPAPEPPHVRGNAGVYLLEPDVVALLPDEGDQHTTLAHLVRTGRLMGFPLDVPWRAINTPQDLADIGEELAERRENATRGAVDAHR